MTDNSTETPVDSTDDLAAFEEQFYGKDTPEVEAPAAKQDEETVEQDDDVIEDDSLAEDDTPAPEGKKKSRFQERINDLTAKNKDLERRYENDLVALRKELEDLKQPKEEVKKPPSTPSSNDDSPRPDDTTDDGEDKYPLGEFDPAYIRDLTKHTIRSEKTRMDIEDAEARQVKEAEQAHQALQTDWQSRLDEAKETYEDLDEKAVPLAEALSGIDSRMAEHLSTTIMGMDNGVDVLYYLANNVSEARAISQMSPIKATLALGRLEARFIKETEEAPKKKVSSAPEPPPKTVKGTKASTSIQPDTDNLDDFEKLFYIKKPR